MKSNIENVSPSTATAITEKWKEAQASNSSGVMAQWLAQKSHVLLSVHDVNTDSFDQTFGAFDELEFLAVNIFVQKHGFTP